MEEQKHDHKSNNLILRLHTLDNFTKKQNHEWCLFKKISVE